MKLSQIKTEFGKALRTMTSDSESLEEMRKIQDNILMEIRGNMGKTADGVLRRQINPSNRNDSRDSLIDNLNKSLPTPIPFKFPKDVKDASDFLKQSEEARNLLVKFQIRKMY